MYSYFCTQLQAAKDSGADPQEQQQQQQQEHTCSHGHQQQQEKEQEQEPQQENEHQLQVQPPLQHARNPFKKRTHWPANIVSNKGKNMPSLLKHFSKETSVLPLERVSSFPAISDCMKSCMTHETKVTKLVLKKPNSAHSNALLFKLFAFFCLQWPTANEECKLLPSPFAGANHQD